MFNFNAGSFSSYVPNKGNGAAGTLYLGDGESYSFYLDVAERNADLKNIQITFNPGGTNDTRVGTYGSAASESENHIYFSGSSGSSSTKITSESTNENGVQFYKIGHNWDYCKYEYTINWATAPSEDGINVVPNWKSDLKWVFRNRSCEDITGLMPSYATWKIIPASTKSNAFANGWFYASEDDSKSFDWRDNGSDWFSQKSYKKIHRINLPEEVGKKYTPEEFHRIFWWWCIGTYDRGDKDYCINSWDISGPEGVYKGFNSVGSYDITTDTGYKGYGLGMPGENAHAGKKKTGVMTDNVSASYGIVTSTNYTNAGTCSMTIKYRDLNNKDYSKTINIVVQKRYCLMNKK